MFLASVKGLHSSYLDTRLTRNSAGSCCCIFTSLMVQCLIVKNLTSAVELLLLCDATLNQRLRYEEKKLNYTFLVNV